MAHNSHSTSESEMPAEFVAEHRAGWHMFTRYTVGLCALVAVTLLLMLIFLRIL